METSVEELDANRVKVHVAVSAAEFEKSIDAAFRTLASQVRIPGFRPGKAPRRILEARFGPEVAREQALKEGVPHYYSDAVEAERLDPIAVPEINITAGEEEGDVEFDAVVEVRPVVKLTGYDELTIELEYEGATDEAVANQLESLRNRFADLTDTEEPLIDGSYAQIDIGATIDGAPVDALTATDFLTEVGSAVITPMLDQELRGKRPGDVLEFTEELPERFGELGGKEATFRVLVKDVKKKTLPDLDDDWVREASEFDTVEELQEDARKRLDLFARVQAQMALRDRVLEELAGLVPVEAPEPLVNQEVEHRLHDLAHRLEPQGVSIAQYLDATGQDQQDYINGLREGAVRAVLADLGLRAVVIAEEIEATDEELQSEIDRLAERVGEKPNKVRRDLERRGMLEEVRSDIARGKALQFLVDHANVVDKDGNAIDLALPDASGDDDNGDETVEEDESSEQEEGTA
ncbi:MAG TPA: trigger factor [Acidimicrobiia bacterium]|jgi:trigger factor